MFHLPTINANFSSGQAVGLFANKITVGSKPVMVTQLGRYHTSGNALMHQVSIWRVEAGPHDDADKPTEAVASVMVDTSQTPAADGFNYVRLEQPVVLDPGQSYYLATVENTFSASPDYFPKKGNSQTGIGSDSLFGSGFQVDQTYNYTRQETVSPGVWVSTYPWLGNDAGFAPLVNIKVN